MNLSMKFPTERVQELEAELKEVRTAFEQYVANSKELESALDKELSELHTKLSNSVSANKVLGDQLENMEPMLSELENALEVSRKKLKEESSLRREAEARSKQAEDLRKENELLKQQNKVLRGEMGWTQPAHQHALRSVIGGNGESLAGDETYMDLLNELEGVTEQLIATQQKLWAAEDKLRMSQSRVQMSRSQTEKEGEVPKNLMDLTESETSDATINSADSNLANELDHVKGQLEEAHKDLKAVGEKAKHAQQQARAIRSTAKTTVDPSHTMGIRPEVYNYEVGELRNHVEHLRKSLVTTQHELKRCQEDLDECREENTTLVEEISCLREVLQDQSDREIEKTQNSEEIRNKLLAGAQQDLLDANKVREREINVLREQLKKIIKENARLHEQIGRLKDGVPESHDEQVHLLSREVARLRSTLDQVEEKNDYVSQEADIEWHLKLEKLREDLEKDKEQSLNDLHAEMMKQRNLAMGVLEDRVEKLRNEKLELTKLVEKLERELRLSRKENARVNEQLSSSASELKASKDEVLALKKKVGILSVDLEHAKQKFNKVEAEAKEARRQYADICGELETVRQILDEAGLSGETIAREDETELKRQIHLLSKDLEQLRQDYTELENEFLESQHRFCASQEESTRKTADEVHYLTGKISEMEASLEAARNDYSELASKLERARRDNHESLTKGEKQGLESALRVFKEQKEHHKALVDSEEPDFEELNAQVGDLTEQLTKIKAELRECKSQLKSSKEENFNLRKNVTIVDRRQEESTEDDDSFQDHSTTKAGGVTQRVPSDDEDEDEGVEVVRASSTAMTDRSDTGDLYSRLLSLTRENSLLKEQLNALAATADDTTLKHAGESKHGVEVEEVKQVIKDLELALKTNEKTLDELDRVSRKLAVTEKKLGATQKAVEEANDENDRLSAKVRELKAAVSEANQNPDIADLELQESRSHSILDDDSEELHDLRDSLKILTDKNVSLQHQLDDAKIALSVSQYAQEQNKEELRASAAKLSDSLEEIFNLKHELNSLSRSLSDVKQAYDDVLDELKLERLDKQEHFQRMEASLSHQMTRLAEENNVLQNTVSELEEALGKAQSEIDSKSKQVSSLHDTLMSAQKETRLLTDEITKLTTAFETSKKEYNAVVDELEAVCDLFEEAREEAERTGKEAAIREIRTELKGSRQKERQAMVEQAKKILEENGSLQKKLLELEHALAEASNTKSGEETTSTKHEMKILREAMNKAEESLNSLRERELALSLELKEAKIELKNARDELELTNQSFDDSRRAAERTARASAIEEFLSLDDNSELKVLREKLTKLIEESKEDTSSSSDYIDPEQSNGLRLKVELINTCMTLEKIMKENAVIEEELECARRSAEEARREGEREGKLYASQEVRREMKNEREQEVNEFKVKFNKLAEENSILSQKLRQAQLQLSVAADSREQGEEEITKLKNDLVTATAEAKRFHQEVLDLTAEMETLREEYEETKHELSSFSVDSDSDAKIKELSGKLNLLSLEQTKLQSKLRITESALEMARVSEEVALSELESCKAKLQKSDEKTADLEKQVSNLKEELHTMTSSNNGLSAEVVKLEKKLEKAEFDLAEAMSNQKENGELRNALKVSRGEAAKLRSQTTQLKRTLEDSTKELDQLREQFERVCSEAAARDMKESDALRGRLNQLAEEKATLQKQVDELKITLSVQKYSHDRNQERLSPTDTSSTFHREDLVKIQIELSETKDEVRDAIDVVRQINQILDTVEGLEPSEREGDNSLIYRIEDIKKKVLEVTSLLREARNEHFKLKDRAERTTAELERLNTKILSGKAAYEEIQEAHLVDKAELETLETKYIEARKEALGHVHEISRLRTALEQAQRNHSSLLEQLGGAKNDDKAIETQHTGMTNNDESSLKRELSKMESALVAAREVEEKQRAIIEQMERESEENAEKAELLESRNQDLSEELEFLRRDLSSTMEKRSAVTQRMSEVKDSLDQKTASIEAAISSDRKAEIRLLQDQFKKLTAKSLSLSKKVEEAEVAVTQMRAKQEETRGEAESRRKQAEDLRSKVAEAIEESKRRDQEIADLSRTMESRVSLAEENINNIAKGLSEARDQMQVLDSGLVVRRRSPKAPEPSAQPAATTAEQRDSSNVDSKDLDIRSEEDDVRSESQEDWHFKSSTIPREEPLIAHTSTSAKDSDITSRALEAIALSKKKIKQRKRDLQSSESSFNPYSITAQPTGNQSQSPELSFADGRE